MDRALFDLPRWQCHHAALLRYKDQAHGTGTRPSNFMRTQLYLRYWFERYGTTGSEMADAGQ